MQVTSNKSTVFDNYKSVFERRILERNEKLLMYKSWVDMSYTDFELLFINYATNVLLDRGVDKSYEIDKYNKPAIEQLYLYFTNKPECKWNLNAGFIFGGKIGCGKTVMLTAFIRMSNEFSKVKTNINDAFSLSQLIKKNGVRDLANIPMFIDEIGREETEMKDYGTKIKPIMDLFDRRYSNGARTYGTTNFKWETLESYYTEHICSRMKEMMTFVVIPGESRRLKNEVKTK